jgi:hypothetical protein
LSNLKADFLFSYLPKLGIYFLYKRISTFSKLCFFSFLVEENF